jgi:hypothetical protein
MIARRACLEVKDQEPLTFVTKETESDLETAPRLPEGRLKDRSDV